MANTKKYVSLDKLGKYDELLKAKMAADDASTLAAAKSYAAGLETNYDAAGAATTAESNAKTYTDTEVAKANAAVAEAKTQADKGIADAATAQKTAQEALDDVKALETYVGSIPEDYSESNVIAYINKKAEETLNSAQGGSSESAASVLAALNTYKSENDPKVTANTDAVAEIKGDYLKTSDKDELQGNIDTVSSSLADVKKDVDAFFADASFTESAKDTLKEIQEYIDSDASAAASMTSSIQQNAKEIDDLEKEVAKKATQSDLDVEIAARTNADSALSGRITTLEKAIGESGSVVEDIATAKQEAIAAAAADSASKANQALVEAKAYADAEDAKIETRVDALETASGTHALASDLNSLTAKVTTAEGEIDTLQSEIDVIKSKANTNESAIGVINATLATKAAQSDLDTANANIATNASAIAAFVECSEEEITGLFV